MMDLTVRCTHWGVMWKGQKNVLVNTGKIVYLSSFHTILTSLSAWRMIRWITCCIWQVILTLWFMPLIRLEQWRQILLAQIICLDLQYSIVQEDLLLRPLMKSMVKIAEIQNCLTNIIVVILILTR